MKKRTLPFIIGALLILTPLAAFFFFYSQLSPTPTPTPNPTKTPVFTPTSLPTPMPQIPTFTPTNPLRPTPTPTRQLSATPAPTVSFTSTPTAPATRVVVAPEILIYYVRPLDTLWGIAGRLLGNPFEWVIIYELNREVIGSDPWVIQPGIGLVMPRD